MDHSDHPDHSDSPGSRDSRELPDSPELPDRRTLAFPRPGDSHRPRAAPQSLSPSLAPSSLNTRRRLYLYTPTADELIHRSLDLAAQVGIATSRIDREIATDITRDRVRRLFPNAPIPLEN